MAGIQSDEKPDQPTPALFFHESPASADDGRYAGKNEMQSRIMACVDDAPTSPAVVRHAIAVARGLGLSVTLARVLEKAQHPGSPADPIEWQLRRAQSQNQLNHIVAHEAGAPVDMDSLLLTGLPADELNRWAEDHNIALLALSTSRDRKLAPSSLGRTAQQLLDKAYASLLLVPATDSIRETVDYRRILVPLDGSSRAESVLPIAKRIARAHGAEIVLAHILPTLKAIDVNSAEQREAELLAMLRMHHERHARNYLEGLRGILLNEGLAASAIVGPQGDARSHLRRLTIEQRIDLTVLSSHGQTGLPDIPCGSVTEYLATHASTPLLIVRPSFAHGFASPIPESPFGTTVQDFKIAH
ncbi:MAG: universal stress protein [Parasphingopyxis sp.]|uniref:universal stress protein n=1 Tax=Parasphingopyxis sp. TaxID=1920299 RepID=UPI003F9F9D9D